MESVECRVVKKLRVEREESALKVVDTSGKVWLVWKSNFSVGVNVFFELNQRLAALLAQYEQYTPSITETHHIHKLDAPSGTARSIGSIIEDTLGVKPEIDARRIGEVPGTHTAEFLSGVDRLTFTHEAFSREGFAEGAVAAALLTEGLTGIHEFKDLIIC